MNANETRQNITNQIVQALESGTIPWRRPWRVSANASGRARNIASRKAYSGVNPLLLALHSMTHGIQSRWYGTFQQWKSIGATVKPRPADVPPGHWGCHVIFYKPLTKLVANQATGKDEEKTFPLLRSFVVFAADQVEGADKFKVLDEQPEGQGIFLPDFLPAEELIAATKADIRVTGEQAFYYRPTPKGSWPNHTGGDFIQVPQRAKFHTLSDWFGAMFHELGHWSEVRLDWEGDYAMGELCAEMAACFISTELGIPGSDDMTNHVAYLQSWLKAMKSDSSFIFKASTQASKVADFLLGFVRHEQVQPEEEAEAA